VADPSPRTPAPKPARQSFWRQIFSRKMVVAFVMGFASGLPLLLTISVLQAWMKRQGVDLGVIGLFALVGLPYTLKFAWAPLLDRYTLPFLGRRRGWLLVIQILLMAAIACLGLSDPGKSPWMVALAAFFVTFFSASQDIVIDAYRREDLTDEELGLGSSLYVNGYRVGMLLAASGGLALADIVPFSLVYLIMAACLLPTLAATVLTPEPKVLSTPRSIREAVVGPFLEYFRRRGAWIMLAFVFFYKIGDQMASAMTTPFYLEIGYSLTDIAAVVKLFGFWATITGGLLGGVVILRLGIGRSLWVFGVLQGVSTAGFAVLANVCVGASQLFPNLPFHAFGQFNQQLYTAGIGGPISALAAVIAFENLSSGMGTTAFVAFMAALTNKKFTATQYALLSSFIGVPRVLASAPTGFMVEAMGWTSFFVFCAVIAVPGLLLLLRFAPWRKKELDVAVDYRPA
jgi:PAT family beta-lactamase induction signal transducer AmpG